MLDSADLKQALKVTSADLKQALKVTNRNERAADAVAALVGKSVALNAIPKLSDIPEKTEELVRRKQILADMYGFVEQNYASVLISGHLFQHGDENRQAFATAYRELYHALMDYINHSMRGMDMLYKADDCECPPWYIWNTSKEDFVNEWEAQYSMKFGDTMAAMSQQQDNMGRYSVAGSGPDCKSGASRLGWFESSTAHHLLICYRGEIGRHGRLKICCRKQRKGSSPFDSTIPVCGRGSAKS